MTTMNEKLLREAFTSLWSDEGVIILVNQSHADVLLPSYLIDRGNIVLDYDPFAVVPIDDLVIEEAGVRATLSFDRLPCKTFVPWEAVLGMTPRLDQAPNATPRVATPRVAAAKPKSHLSLCK
jgi:hypothetical protein